MVSAGTCVLLAGCGGSSFQALPVQEAPVKKVEFTEDIQTVSTLEAKDLVALAAQASGRIDELKIAQGDLVEAGQLLLVLDQEQENARLRSEVAKAETDKLNYQRYEYLASQGAVSEMQRDQRRQAYISSRERAIAQQATVGYSNLTSPMAGTVADVKVKLGDVLRQGDVFTLLVKNNTLKARIDIPAKFGDRVEVGFGNFLALINAKNFQVAVSRKLVIIVKLVIAQFLKQLRDVMFFEFTGTTSYLVHGNDFVLDSFVVPTIFSQLFRYDGRRHEIVLI